MNKSADNREQVAERQRKRDLVNIATMLAMYFLGLLNGYLL